MFREIAVSANYRLVLSRMLVPDVPVLNLDIPEILDVVRNDPVGVLSGSADSLAGRISRLNVFGFSQDELAGKMDDSVPAVLEGAQLQAFSSEMVKASRVERAPIPAATITSYLDLVYDVQLIAPIKPWTPNLAKREIGRLKILVPV